jgi:DNA-binding CsgD family transcriptional regulator
MEVVSWIGRGKRNEEIAKILGCSTRTVKKHVQRVLKKLRMETRTSACAWWHEQGKKIAPPAAQKRRSPAAPCR